MSAILRRAVGPKILVIRHDPNDAFFCAIDAHAIGELTFFDKDLFDGVAEYRTKSPERCNSFAFDYTVPESFLPGLIGRDPERVVEGFTASDKPNGCRWMDNSRIKSIVNHLGSILVELEPAAVDG